MIVVKVELHSAITGNVKELGRMHICNDGTGDDSTGHYDGKLLRKGSKSSVFKEGRVENYKRWRYNVWVLVKEMLNNMYNKDK